LIGLPTVLASSLEKTLGRTIVQSHPVSGGDINEASLAITSDQQKLFIKYNKSSVGPRILDAEKKGLETIAATHLIKTPEILCEGIAGDYGYLVLEYFDTMSPSHSFWINFATSLAALHQVTADQFGFETDNFIGSLKQQNNKRGTWLSFYRYERLEPQITMATEKNLLNKKDRVNLENLCEKLPSIIPDSSIPALIHGDLWAGNFLCTDSGVVLIDPSVSFAHIEMDLAMTQLFGGFPAIFYDTYNACSKLESGWEDRLSLYKLYYLLVHVNIFGRSYLGGVRQIVEAYI
jgi:fructosamine-3-kinase